MPSRVSWSVRAIAVSPATTARRTTSAGGSVPSEHLLCRWRSTGNGADQEQTGRGVVTAAAPHQVGEGEHTLDHDRPDGSGADATHQPLAVGFLLLHGAP
jgi:hypothetical protein